MLEAVMIGDALGAPVETMSRQEILDATAGKGVAGFVRPLQTRIADTQHLQPGDTTDDWHLTETVGWALVRAGQLNLDEMARAHVTARERRHVGWGGTTDEAVSEMQLWLQSDGRQGRAPQQPVAAQREGFGAGNGVAMKISALAAMHTLIQSPAHVMLRDVLALARMTHHAPEAMWAAWVLCCALRGALDGSLPSDAGAQARWLQARLSWASAQPDMPDSNVIERRLRELADHAGDAEGIYRTIGPSFQAQTSVMYAVGIAGCYGTDVRGALLRAVNDGGDCDSTASMAGAICAASGGVSAVPDQWRNGVNVQRAHTLADALIDKFAT